MIETYICSGALSHQKHTQCNGRARRPTSNDLLAHGPETKNLISSPSSSSREASTARSCAPLQTFHVNSHAQAHTALPPPASCLSSPPPRRSARPSPAAALSRPGAGQSCPPQAAAAPCTWRSRAGAASRPARSGGSRSAAARSVAAAASRRPRRPAWTRRSRLSGKVSRWGSRCRRSPCRCCRTRTRLTSGRDPSGSPLASSCSTCGRSASSSVSLLVVWPWLPTTTGQQTSGTLLLTRNHSNHRSSLRSQNHQVQMCLKVIQLK